MNKIKEYIGKYTTQAKIIIILIISAILLSFYIFLTGSHWSKIEIMVPYLTPPRESIIFLDNKEVRNTTKNKQTIILKNIKEGEHSIVVSSQERYPWEKTVNIKNNTTSELHPFLMRIALNKNSSGTITKFSKAELVKIGLLFNKQNNINTFLSDDGSVKIKKEKNQILKIQNVDKKTVSIFSSSKGPIKKVEFYPNRKDVVVFTLKDSIYAIETTKNGTQNFQPIYTGQNPDFAIDNKTSIIYIKDKGALFGVNL